jgi:hypothetical protein
MTCDVHVTMTVLPNFTLWHYSHLHELKNVLKRITGQDFLSYLRKWKLVDDVKAELLYLLCFSAPYYDFKFVAAASLFTSKAPLC